MDVSPAGFTPAAGSASSSRRQLPQSVTAVIAAFEPRIKFFARRHSRRPYDLDDLIQVGRIAVWRAIHAYDPTRGYPLDHYASRAIVRAMRRELRKEQRHWHDRVDLPPQESGSEDLLDDVLDEQTRRAAAEQNAEPGYWEILSEHVLARVHQLPPRLRRVYELRHVQGRTQPEVAQILKVTQQRVSQIERQLARAICHEA